MKLLKNDDFKNKRSYEIKIYGVVQGVGFRPYIYNQAIKHNIKGWVSNQGSAVLMDIEGNRENIKEFLLSIIKNPPALAKIEKVEVILRVLKEWDNFKIIPSSVEENGIKFMATDVSICPDCLNDISDPADSRYHYPFTNCTNCGPRYSLIRKLPYDRENTTMEKFKMCPECEREYNDPFNRRFHAQTNCCPNCGPKLSLLNNMGGEIICSDEVLMTTDMLKDGKIVANKGIGGFHLACDAHNEDTVKILRQRKKRPHKPFAIMVKNIEVAKKLCYINQYEEKLLLSNKRPIVLLEKKETSNLPDTVAFNMKKLGIMLPYTPLHYLLFQNDITCLVMTSGNISNSPIQFENEKAIENLGTIADYFLMHNRDINIPVEDSVVKTLCNNEIVVRMARGYTPFIFPMNCNIEMLALGAEEKSTFCLSQNRYLYMSQYMGDLKNYDTYINFEKAIDNMMSLLNFKPELIVHDMYTIYQSSKYALNNTVRKIPVHHHHAHMVSCMVEHKLFCPVIGVIFDGTGLGLDGNIWGGEFLIGTRKNFIRVGHFRYVTIQGGDKSIKEPWRIAVSYLRSINYEFNDIVNAIDEKNVDAVNQAIDSKMNCYETSSVGRFFDCIASLLNVRHYITYDAQAAIELENILDPSVKDEYPFTVVDENEVYIIEYKDILLSVIRDIKKGKPTSFISAKFHNTISSATSELVIKISKKYKVKKL
ncbi:MAG: carbamoyltransferase HypF, partial [Bacillota bacterium]|nr:carbamoyltransferase HypF [Bacillota bacterium]